MLSLHNLEQAFKRSLFSCFSIYKLFSIFIVLFLSGLLFVFSRGLSFGAHPWVSMSLVFLPFFVSSSLLMALGVILTRAYTDDRYQKERRFSSLIFQSWELLMGVAYLCIPSILLYLIFWFFLGMFFLLREIPTIGGFIGVFLSFAPFLLVLGMLFLLCMHLLALFFLTPLIALQKDKNQWILALKNQLKDFPLTSLLSFLIAFFPLFFTALLLSCAAYLSYGGWEQQSIMHAILHCFFVMLPFSFLLSPAFLFFFHFSAEMYLLHRK